MYEVNVLDMSNLELSAYKELMLKNINVSSSFSLNNIGSDDPEFTLLKFKKMLNYINEAINAQLALNGKTNELTEKTASVSL